MRTFAQKPEAVHKTNTAKSTKPHWQRSGQSRDVYSILHLQRTIGNHAVQPLLRSETENIEANSASNTSTGFAYDFSRISVYGNSHSSIQSKMNVNTQRNQYDQEADRVADQVIEEVSDEADASNKSMAAQVAAMPGADAVPDAEQLFGAATQGNPQEIPYRSDMESAYNADFSAVQAYTDVSNPLGAMGAEAAALDESVAFASPSPDRAVVAHELAHVMQSRASSTSAVIVGSSLSQPSDLAEVEAERAAAAVIAGDPVPAITHRPSAQINRSFISFALKMGAKKASKGMLKNFIKTKIKSRLKKLTNKKLVKELAQEADDVLGMLDDPWWVTAIGFIPIAGDAFDLVHVPMKIRSAMKRADRLEDKAKKALQAQRVVKRGRQITEQASRLGYKTRIAANRAPFKSMGQTVFWNGKNYITRDITSHRGGVWKMFDRQGRRLGTYDANLKWIAP